MNFDKISHPKTEYKSKRYFTSIQIQKMKTKKEGMQQNMKELALRPFKIPRPSYEAITPCYIIREHFIYERPDPNHPRYDTQLQRLRMLPIWKNAVFTEKIDAVKELILYLYYEWYYTPLFDIKDIYSHVFTDEDIEHLENYCKYRLENNMCSWDIRELRMCK